MDRSEALKVGQRGDRSGGQRVDPRVDHSGDRWGDHSEGHSGGQRVDHSGDRWGDLRVGHWEGHSGGRWGGLRVGHWEDQLEVQRVDLSVGMLVWTEALVESRPPQMGQARVEE